MVTVVDRQLLQIFAHELTGAATTNPRIDFQGLLAVAEFSLLPIAHGLGDHPVSVRTLCIINSHKLGSLNN